MPQQQQLQNVFTLGELDPLLHARIDFEGYYKGAKTLRNVNVIPQGGCKRRFGTTPINALPANVASANQITFAVFKFAPSIDYLMVIRPDTPNPMVAPGDPTAIDIYFNGNLIQTLTAVDGVPWTVDQIPNLKYTRGQDRVIWFHPNVIWQNVKIDPATGMFEIFPAIIVYAAPFDYSSLDQIRYDGPGFTFTPSATTGNVTLTASGNIFTSNHIGGVYSGNGGVLRITGVTSGTVATGFTLSAFANTNAILGSLSQLQEPIWGNGGMVGAAPPGPARGWPTCGCFFQNRFAVGGFLSAPNAFAASVAGDYEDFDTEDPVAQSAFVYVLTSDSLNTIQFMMGTKSLICFTTNSVWATNLLFDTAITFQNVFLTEQNRDAIGQPQAFQIDNQVLFVDGGGKSVRTLLYETLEAGYHTESASLYSPHLINSPVEGATFKNPTIDDGSYFFLVNSDGTLAMYQTLIDQKVSGWTLGDTRGFFKDITSSKNDAYFITNRYVASTIRHDPPLAVYKVNNTFNTFTDITSTFALNLGNTSLFDNINEYLVIGHIVPFTELTININTFANTSIGPVFEYLDNQGNWVPLNAVVDTTAGFTVAGNMTWTFTNTKTWVPNTLNGINNYFWLRIKRNLAVAQVPIITTGNVNMQSNFYIEKLDFAHIMDVATLTQTDNNGVAHGLNNFANNQVWALLQTELQQPINGQIIGIPIGPLFVDAAGNLDFSVLGLGTNYANTFFYVGLDYTPLIIPMPTIGQGQDGTNVYFPKLTKAIYVDYFNSLGLIVDGTAIPNLNVGGIVLNAPLNPLTGYYQIVPQSGWDPRREILITQDQPLPFTLRGIGYLVEY